jgi:hypothetical protein
LEIDPDEPCQFPLAPRPLRLDEACTT